MGEWVETIRGVEVRFPFKPYDLQVDYMGKVIEALQLREHAALESPTGTGKTLSLLCSSLAWLEQDRARAMANASLLPERVTENTDSIQSRGGFGNRRIYYGSRTHTQLTQGISELKRTAYNHVSAVVLASREHYCIHEEVSKLSDHRLQNIACAEKVKNHLCYYRSNLDKDIPSKEALNGVMDIEDLVTFGKKSKVCPYYLSKDLAQKSSIVFTPYNYLLNVSNVKDSSELAHSVVIIDEAHNTEQVCEEYASREIKLSDVALCLDEVNQVLENYEGYEQAVALNPVMSGDAASTFTKEDLLILKQSFAEIEEGLIGISVSTEGSTLPNNEVFKILEKGKITAEKYKIFQKFCVDLRGFLSSTAGMNMFKRHGNGVEKFADFIEGVFASAADGGEQFFRSFIKSEQMKGFSANILKNAADKILNVWCFSPSFTMKLLLKRDIHCVILTSGTLAPLSGFAAQMRIPLPIRIENPHIIEDSQVFVGIVKEGPGAVGFNSSFKTRDNPAYKRALGLLILNVARNANGGVLVFFPSYFLMDSCRKAWEENGMWKAMTAVKRVYMETRMRSDFTTTMNGYYEDIRERNGAIFLAVCRGKVSEGLDFADANGRAVIITGIPYPNWQDSKVKLKQKFLDDMHSSSSDEHGLTGREWYSQEASRAVNQAIGRVIRHANDYGAIILADCRFADPNFIKNLSSWVRPRIKVCNDFGSAISGIVKFFKAAESNPRLKKTTERAYAPPPERTIPTVNSALMPDMPTKMVSKRSLSEITTRPSHFGYSSRGNMAAVARVLASGTPDRKLLVDNISDQGQKKLKLVPNAEQAADDLKRDEDEKRLVASTNYLRRLRTELVIEDYKAIALAMRNFKENKRLDDLVDAFDSILLVKYNLPSLFMDLKIFLGEKEQISFEQFARERVGPSVVKSGMGL